VLGATGQADMSGDGFAPLNRPLQIPEWDVNMD
jgi:hypothetical protein